MPSTRLSVKYLMHILPEGSITIIQHEINTRKIFNSRLFFEPAVLPNLDHFLDNLSIKVKMRSKVR